MATWLGTYAAETPGVKPILNASLPLDWDNEPQPHAGLFRLPSHGGKARVSEDDYIEGAPELLAEVAGSSRAYDLHSKMEACRHNGALEYLVWITGENRVIWWTLPRGEYHELTTDADGVLRSKVFPGLWLDVPALLRGELKNGVGRVAGRLREPVTGEDWGEMWVGAPPFSIRIGRHPVDRHPGSTG